MEPRNFGDKRFALLIDADNVSAKYINVVLDELSKYGTVTYKRIYGDWTSTLHSKWKDTLLDNSITPIQQFSYSKGKNATDHAMIIDAMDILYTGQVDGFCIVSSDSDFTRLAARIRESGLTVIGMGEKKTPLAFRKACDIFTTLELLMEDVPTDKTHTPHKSGRTVDSPAPAISKERIEEAVVSIVTYNQNNGKDTGLGEVGSRLQKRYPDFDVRNYGTNQLKKLLDDFASVVVTQEGNSISVNLAEGVAESADKAADAAPVVKADDEIAPEAAQQEDQTDKAAAEPEATEDQQPAAPKKRTHRGRRGGRGRAKQAAAQAEEQPENQVGEDSPAEEAATAPLTEAVASEAEAADAAPQPATDGASAADAASDTPAATEDDAKPAPRKRTRRSRRKTKVNGSAPAEAGAEAETPLPAQETEPADAHAAPDAAPQDAPAATEPEHQNQPAPAPQLDATDDAPALDVDAIRAYISNQLAQAPAPGIALTTLGNRVRRQFKNFKLHDLGYRKFKDFVLDIENVDVTSEDGKSFASTKR